jgi:hypothetical protein
LEGGVETNGGTHQSIAHALQHLREEVEAKGVPNDRGDLQDQLLSGSEFVKAIDDDVVLSCGKAVDPMEVVMSKTFPQ